MVRFSSLAMTVSALEGLLGSTREMLLVVVRKILVSLLF
jgi:hypothetical protein